MNLYELIKFIFIFDITIISCEIFMKTSYKPPFKRKYFHSQKKINSKNISLDKKKIEMFNQKNYKKNI